MDREREYHVRLARPDDAAPIRAIYAPFVETTPISFEVEPPSVAAMADRIETTLQEYPWLVCEAAGEVIGYAAASALRPTPPYRWTVELSVYVGESVRRSGVGTALYTSLLAALSLQGYHNAYAVTTLPNPASTALHERLGFEPVGTFPAVGYKHGDWHDVQWWYRQLDTETGVGPDTDANPNAQTQPSDPDPPTPLPEMRERNADELETALEAGESHENR